MPPGLLTLHIEYDLPCKVLVCLSALCSFILGRCPYYDSLHGNINQKPCNPDIGPCSQGHFRSPSSLKCKYQTGSIEIV